MFEKVVQLSEHEILGFGVLIGELEHHGPDEDLAAGVCLSFADCEARADPSDSRVNIGLPFGQFGLQPLPLLLQFFKLLFVCQSHGLTCFSSRNGVRLPYTIAIHRGGEDGGSVKRGAGTVRIAGADYRGEFCKSK